MRDAGPWNMPEVRFDIPMSRSRVIPAYRSRRLDPTNASVRFCGRVDVDARHPHAVEDDPGDRSRDD